MKTNETFNIKELCGENYASARVALYASTGNKTVSIQYTFTHPLLQDLYNWMTKTHGDDALKQFIKPILDENGMRLIYGPRVFMKGDGYYSWSFDCHWDRLPGQVTKTVLWRSRIAVRSLQIKITEALQEMLKQYPLIDVRYEL